MANLNLSEFGEKLFVADADHTFIWDTAASISKRVSRNSWLSAGSIATSTPLTISQTWTDAGVTFAAMKIVATDTNSAAGSDFLELYSGTATQPLRLDIQKTGQLNIYGTWSNSTSYERLSFSAPTAANAIIGTNKGSGGGTARGLDLHTNGAARMTITSNGNVGIGTTTPTRLFTIVGSVTGTNVALIQNTDSAGYAELGFDNDTPFAGNIGCFAFGYGGTATADPNNAYFFNRRAGAIFFGTTAAERMRITAAGNVGIGTTSPTSKLQVSAGDVEVDTIAKGVILKSPDGTRYRVTVANGGTLSVAAV